METHHNKRSTFSGKLGFVLSAAGASVGLGNICPLETWLLKEELSEAASHSKESRQIEKAGLFAFAELFEDGPIPEKDVGFSCKSNSRVGKILIGQHGGHVAFIKFHACIGFLDCFVSKIIGITFALDAIFFPMFPGQNINALIAAAPGDFYMVKAVSAEQSGTVVLKGMTVHSVVRFLHCNDSSPVRILSFSR